MSYQITGTLISRGAIQQVTDNFRKVDFVLEVEDGAYMQYVKMQLTQNNCEKVMQFKKGDTLTANFNLRGRAYEKDGKTSYFTNIECWNLEKVIHAPEPQPEPEPQTNEATEGFDELPF